MKRLVLVIFVMAAMVVGSAVAGDGGLQCFQRCEAACTVQASVAANAAQLMGLDGGDVYNSTYNSCTSACQCYITEAQKSRQSSDKVVGVE